MAKSTNLFDPFKLPRTKKSAQIVSKSSLLNKLNGDEEKAQKEYDALISLFTELGCNFKVID